jgi:hypothetical protein
MFKDRKSEEFLETVRSHMTAMDDDIPEPDWSEFRSSVRDKLLSRSVRHTGAVRRWKLAWAFSFVAVIAITTSLLWNVKFRPIGENGGADLIVPNYAETTVNDWPQGALFDDLVQLGDMEEEQLRLMLEMEQ